MNKKQQQLVDKRERLVAQISAQRVTLAQNLEPWVMPLTLVGQGMSLLRCIRRNPALIAGIVVLTVVIKPQYILKWLGRGWVTWQVIDKLRDR
jgi:hypothetical protein